MANSLLWMGICATCASACASFDVTWQPADDPVTSPDSGIPIPDAASVVSDAPPVAIDAPPAAAFCPPGDDTLIACYDFDGQSGEDGSPYGHDLTTTNVGFQPGVTGYALHVNTGSTVRTPGSPALNVAAVTMELWIYPEELPQAGRMGLIDSDGRYGMFLYAGGQVRCSSSSGSTTLFIDYDLPLQAWTHLACTNDGNELALWVDGTMRGNTSSSPLASSGNGGLAVGMNSPSGDNFVGAIDNVRVWEIIRSSEEICAAADANCAAP